MIRLIWSRLRRSGVFRATSLKVLLFAAACLVLLVALAIRIGNVSLFSHRETYGAELSDATGLTPSDDVKVAGVTVGQVTGVSLQRAHALVTFALDGNFKLRSGTQAGLQWQNVIGQKYLYLYPDPSGRLLKPGSVLPLSNSLPEADVGSLLNTLGPLLSAIHPQQANEVVETFATALQGDEGQIDQLIQNAASVSQTVGSSDTQIGSLVTDLNEVMGALSQRSGDLGEVISNLQSVSGALAGRNDLLDQTVGNLGTISAEVATLESNTHDSLSQAIADLQTVSNMIQGRESQLSQGLSTLGSGLAGYQEISSYGQWFQVQVVYGCLANEAFCNYYEGTNPPAGTGPGGSAPASSGTLTPAGSSAPLGLPGSSGSSNSSAPVGNVLKMVAGQGSFLGSDAP
jgi:phospholipid/cholesterol/gamma-HCH transport system substrate-binding protein